ncbi:uncharacterized protein LTHEOB_8527 [Lasiodiplodia theobromae]|uniref:uncharacterized protein n=1 Tax=Lasiodiplodia theobromae TaxID=45133 RepID=UPI0015C39AA6|nr:uncharacterized protein LTHEOB_8527 [Lasiodiplodia theobromae]KAF4541532.1 hypothetical protein LTHEOB_8527 [Lasiodiplodia theobromae]
MRTSNRTPSHGIDEAAVVEKDIRARIPLRWEFFSTEMFVRDRSGGPQIPAIGRQDSLCAVPLICSFRWIREMNQESAVTRDVKCPGTTSITGHEVSFQGVVRNMVFTLKGLTFRRDVWVCDQLDSLYDFVFGASFIKQNFRLLFQKMFRGAKNIFAGWFTKRKETPEEKREAEALRAKQESEADILEKARQARQAEEREKRKQASIHETNASSL